MMKQPLAALKEQVMPEDERMMPAGAFIGMRVMCDDAVLLGHVDNILIDTSDGWRIPFIQVKLSREAKGLWEKGSDKAAPPLVNVMTGSIRAVGDMVILSLTVDQVREGSERESSNALNTGGAEGRSVH
jgi:sporulation protein YlmC with PRC-barrel domain